MTTVNAGYALAQLERALIAHASDADSDVRERARVRVGAWGRVIEGMSSGALTIGSRTPTKAPVWATLDVVHGGFATGTLAAGGPLLPHERTLAGRLQAPTDDRRALALHFLSDAGRDELRAMLETGCFRIDVPEEAALLCVVALLARGAVDRAAAVIEEIAPYFHELRFHPKPSSRALSAVTTVHVATIGDTRAKIAALATPLEVRRMNESLTVWAPLLDRAVDLFLETTVDGVPCGFVPEGWRGRALAFLADHAAARASHKLCKKPHRPKENLAILVDACVQLTAPAGALSPRALGLARVAIAGHVQAHGAPKSGRRCAHRAEQARVASGPTRGQSAKALDARLAPLPSDSALASMDEISAPISEGGHVGIPLWPSVAAKLQRCLDASVEELVERGVLTSGEAIAKVLPQISAHVRALGFADPEIARLFAAIDAAFRRRRSVLLLDYQSQVKLEELPWIAALEPFRTDHGASRGASQRLFASVTSLAIDSFPHAIIPNPLIEELRALAQRAGLDLPFVDELAADIFMGGFTAKFVRSAAIVVRRLEGTLYARYYALPVAEVLAIEDSLRPPAKGPVPAFGKLCERMAALGADAYGSVSRSGRVIEQQQILTTQNLVPLIDAAGVAAERFPDIAWRAFEWLIRRAQVGVRDRIHQLRNAKNVAYAWRQTIAYLSLAPANATATFLANARAHLLRQREPFRVRFAPILAGLEAAHGGGEPPVRLLGWSSGSHPLLSDEATAIDMR